MTIAAGFRFIDRANPHLSGVLLCADTLYTVPGVMKLQGTKVFVYNFPKMDMGRAAFTFAGDRTFARMALDEIEREINAQGPEAKTVESMRTTVENVLVRIYREHLYIRPDFPAYAPSFQFLFALWSPIDGLGFYSTLETAVTEVSMYEFLGSGASLAHYLAKHHHNPADGYRAAIRVSTMILDACMEHIDGCGGQSEFFTLCKNGSSTQTLAFVQPYMQNLDEIERAMQIKPLPGG